MGFLLSLYECFTYPYEASLSTLRVPVDIIRFLDHIRYQLPFFLFFHRYCKYNTLVAIKGRRSRFYASPRHQRCMSEGSYLL